MGAGDGAGNCDCKLTDGVDEALVADVCGGLFDVAISVLLVDNDGFSDGDCGVVRAGARLRLEESDDGSGAAARLGASDVVADGASVRELYSLTPVGSSVGESDGVADGASVGIKEL